MTSVNIFASCEAFYTLFHQKQSEEFIESISTLAHKYKFIKSPDFISDISLEQRIERYIDLKSEINGLLSNNKYIQTEALIDHFVELNEYIIRDISNELEKISISNSIKKAVFKEQSLTYSYIEILPTGNSSSMMNRRFQKYKGLYKIDELTIDFIRFDALNSAAFFIPQLRRVEIGFINLKGLIVDQKVFGTIKHEVKHASFFSNMVENDIDTILQYAFFQSSDRKCKYPSKLCNIY